MVVVCLLILCILNKIRSLLSNLEDDICKSLPHARNWKWTGVWRKKVYTAVPVASVTEPLTEQTVVSIWWVWSEFIGINTNLFSCISVKNSNAHPDASELHKQEEIRDPQCQGLPLSHRCSLLSCVPGDVVASQKKFKEHFCLVSSLSWK